MSPKEHAEIWRRAAQVVGDMDTIASEMRMQQQRYRSLPAEQQAMGTYMSRSYGPEEAAANRAFSAAARVLSVIAQEYEKAARGQTDER